MQRKHFWKSPCNIPTFYDPWWIHEGFMKVPWRRLFKRVPLGENRVEQLGATSTALEREFDVNYGAPIPKRHRGLFWRLDGCFSNSKFAQRINGIKKLFLWVYRAFLTSYPMPKSNIHSNKLFLLLISTCYKKKRKKRSIFMAMRRNHQYHWYYQLLL